MKLGYCELKLKAGMGNIKNESTVLTNPIIQCSLESSPIESYIEIFSAMFFTWFFRFIFYGNFPLSLSMNTISIVNFLIISH